MNAQLVDWSDVPFILAVCEEGSLSRAARALNVNHSTVFRRVEGVEKRLGVRLFDRRSRGYVMTSAGEAFFQQATQLRDGLANIERQLGGKDQRLSGPLTITTTDSLSESLIPILAAFQDLQPAIELRLIIDARSLDLSRRDADIAIRPTAAPPEHWFGRKAAVLEFATYAHSDYIASLGGSPIDKGRWIELDADLGQSPMSKMTQELKPANAPTTIVSTIIGIADYLDAGTGIAVLPCYLGDRHAELERVTPADPRHSWDLWLLAHPDLRGSARVHAFMEFAATRIASDLSGLCK